MVEKHPEKFITWIDLLDIKSEIVDALQERIADLMKPEFYTPKKFAEATGLSVSVVRYYINAGVIEAVQPQERKNSCWLIPKTEISRLTKKAKANLLPN